MVTLSSEIQAIHRKCIRLLIITARFNCRSRCLMLTSPRRCDLVTSHLSPFTADRSLSQPRKSFQSVWWSDSSPPPVSAHLGTREDKRLSEGSTAQGSIARTPSFTALCLSSQELPPEPARGLFSIPNPSPSVHLHRVCFAEHFTLGGFTALWFFLTPLKWFSLFWDMLALGLTQAVCLCQLGLSKRQEHSSPTIKELLSSITSICNTSEGFSLSNKERIAQIKQEKHQLLTQPQQGTALVCKHLKSRLSVNSKASGWRWIFQSPSKSMTWASPTPPSHNSRELTQHLRSVWSHRWTHKLHKAESPGSTN